MDIQRYKKPIIIAACIVIALVAAWLIYFYFFTFSVLSVSPSKTRFSTVSPIIKIETTRAISDKTITFDDGGTGIVASVKHTDKTIIVNLYQNMRADKEYTVTLKGIESKDGYRMQSFVYTFTPVNDPSLVSSEENKIILQRQDEKPSIVSDPVASATPITSDSYVVKSVMNATPDGKGSVSLVATIFITREEAEQGYQAAVDTHKAEIFEALSKIKEYSADAYPITFTIQGP